MADWRVLSPLIVPLYWHDADVIALSTREQISQPPCADLVTQASGLCWNLNHAGCSLWAWYEMIKCSQVSHSILDCDHQRIRKLNWPISSCAVDLLGFLEPSTKFLKKIVAREM
jgi:hypothetical protein